MVAIIFFFLVYSMLAGTNEVVKRLRGREADEETLPCGCEILVVVDGCNGYGKGTWQRYIFPSHSSRAKENWVHA
jgi:hypothetical protein